jgi:hypothetical protein
MTSLKVPTAMVFVRAKDGISHSPKEWSSKEDCAEGALVLGKAVLNFDELLRRRVFRTGNKRIAEFFIAVNTDRKKLGITELYESIKYART